MILNLLIPNLIFINRLKILLKDRIQLLLSELSARFWSRDSNQEFRLVLILTRTFSISGFFGSHVALLRAAEGLLDERKGQTELSVALARMAGITPAMVVCEMLDNNNGKALSKEDSKEYGKEHGLVFLEGKEIVEAYMTWQCLMLILAMALL